MRLTSENYKGIEFIRVSSLPANQQEVFWQSFDKNKIVKILTQTALFNDCIQYGDYSKWFSKNFTGQEEIVSNPADLPWPARQVM